MKSRSMMNNQQLLTRRDFLRLMGVTTAGVALASCAPWAGNTPPSNTAVQLVYQDWSTDWFSGMAQRLLEQFSVGRATRQFVLCQHCAFTHR